MAAEFAQNSPELPNFVKICPKTISLRNFEIPPKIEILISFKKKNLYVEDAPSMFSPFGFSIQQFFVCVF
jgi:hypothetical protein